MFEKLNPSHSFGAGPSRSQWPRAAMVFQTFMDHKRFRYETKKYFGICDFHGRGSGHRRNSLRI